MDQPKSGESAFHAYGVLERRAKPRREQVRGALLGDDHIVFEPEAEVAAHVDAGLVGKGHARLEERLAPADQVGIFVAVEADAVADPVREEFVVFAVARSGDHGSGSIVHRARKPPAPRRLEGSVLSQAHRFKRPPQLVRWLAEYRAPR